MSENGILGRGLELEEAGHVTDENLGGIRKMGILGRGLERLPLCERRAGDVVFGRVRKMGILGRGLERDKEQLVATEAAADGVRKMGILGRGLEPSAFQWP